MKRTWGISGSFLSSQNFGLLAQNVLAAAAEGLGYSLCANGRGVPADKALGDVLWIANVRIAFDVFAYLAIGVRQSRCCAKVPQAAIAALSSSPRILPRRTSIDAIFSRQFLFFAAADAAKNLPVLATI